MAVSTDFERAACAAINRCGPDAFLQISTVLGSAVKEQREESAWSEGVAIWVAVIVVSGVGAASVQIFLSCSAASQPEGLTASPVEFCAELRWSHPYHHQQQLKSSRG